MINISHSVETMLKELDRGENRRVSINCGPDESTAGALWSDFVNKDKTSKYDAVIISHLDFTGMTINYQLLVHRGEL